MRMLFSISTILIVCLASPAFAESVAGLGNVQGVVIKDLFHQDAFTLKEGQVLDCQATSGRSKSCSLADSSVVVTSGQDSVQFSPTKLLMSEIDGSDGTTFYFYNYIGEWKKSVGSVVINSPVLLSFNFSSKNPARLVGNLRLKAYDLSYPVEAIRTAP